VDRWQQLEAERAPFDPAALLNKPPIMRGLLLSYTEKVLALESEVDAMRDDVAAHERLTKADGTLSITEAAKALEMRPKDLFQWPSHNWWIYKRPNGAAAPRRNMAHWRDLDPRWKTSQGGSRGALGAIYGESVQTVRTTFALGVRLKLRLVPEAVSNLSDDPDNAPRFGAIATSCRAGVEQAYAALS
jgi:hypothetical protein